MIDTVKIRADVSALCKDTYKWKTGSQYNGLNKQNFIETMQTQYEYLFTNSKSLFEKCIDGSMDMKRLDEMLSMIEKVSQGKDYFTASTEIGQSLTDFYVKPLIENKEKQK
jgi:hypothetical protein